MTLKLTNKKLIVKEIAKQALLSLSAAMADYRGLTAGQMDSLRKQARESGVYLKVIRNNLAKIAVKGTRFECMKNAFTDPLILAFSKEEPNAAAKLFKSFMKNNKKLKVKNLSIGGKLFGADKLEEISKIPNRHDAFLLLCSVILEPVRKLVAATNDIPSQTVRVFAATGNTK